MPSRSSLCPHLFMQSTLLARIPGKAQARMIVTPRVQQHAVAIIEMKVTGQLFWGWLPDIAAIPAARLDC